MPTPEIAADVRAGRLLLRGPIGQTWDKDAIKAEKDEAAQARLRAAGWIVCPPGSVPMPRTRQEAAAMHKLAEMYLDANPENGGAE